MRLTGSKSSKCANCKFGTAISVGEIACSKHGIMSSKGRCRAFKRKNSKKDTEQRPAATAKKPATLDNPPVSPEQPIAPTPSAPPKIPDTPTPPVAPTPPIPPKLTNALTPPVPPTPPKMLIAPTPPTLPKISYPPKNPDDNPENPHSQHVDRVIIEQEKELTAKSTLKSDGGIEGLIKVFEVGEGIYAKKETIRNRIWVHDLFDDNGIEYYIEMELKSQGKQLAEVQSIYVRPEEKNDAFYLIWTFNNAELIAPEYTPDVATQIMVDGIPQKECINCKEEIDFDYHTCPHCKAAV